MNLKYVNGKKMKENKSNYFDEYYTKKNISYELYKKTIEIISNYEENINEYTWLEPSVGMGCFFEHLPPNKIGIDIAPKIKDVIKHDYLSYELPKKKLIVIGNPPFGHRGVLALEFINHSAAAEYVAFILPMFFKSTGKGSIRYRVKNFNLIYEQNLQPNSFYLPNGKDVDVKCCFQIWSKNHKINNCEFSWYNNKNKEPFGELLKLVTVSLAKNRECGKEWIFNKKANWYLSSTFFKENQVVSTFDKVKYKSGVAIIYNENNNKETNKKLDSILKNVNWKDYASLATNGCYHIGKSNIFKLLKDNFGEK